MVFTEKSKFVLYTLKLLGNLNKKINLFGTSNGIVGVSYHIDIIDVNTQFTYLLKQIKHEYYIFNKPEATTCEFYGTLFIDLAQHF